MKVIRVKCGYLGGRQLTNVDFPFVHGLKTGSHGLYVKVNGEGIAGYPQRNFRILVDDCDHVEFFERVAPDPVVVNTSTVFSPEGLQPIDTLVGETDEEIRDRMIERFGILRQLSISSARGINRGLVVYGGSGVGKSHEVVEAMVSVNAYNKIQFQKMMEAVDDTLTKNPPPVGHSGPISVEDPVTGIDIPQFYTFYIHKGHITASGLYHLLYNNRRPNEIVLIDDGDGLLANEETIGVLKSALDTTVDRHIQWAISGTRVDQVPGIFLYEGSCVFITNTNFEELANSQNKIAPHIEAILDRCLYLDLMLTTTREKLVRIDYVCREQKMFERELLKTPTNIQPEDVGRIAEELLAWTHQHANDFKRLSLRTMHHFAGLRRTAENWQRLAEVTLLRGRR